MSRKRVRPAAPPGCAAENESFDEFKHRRDREDREAAIVAIDAFAPFLRWIEKHVSAMLPKRNREALEKLIVQRAIEYGGPGMMDVYGS